LIAHHADINVVDSQGDTPLHDAARNGHLLVVRLLVENGATFLRNNDQKGPAQVASVEAVQEYLWLPQLAGLLVKDLCQLFRLLQAANSPSYFMLLPAEIRNELIEFATTDPWDLHTVFRTSIR